MKKRSILALAAVIVFLAAQFTFAAALAAGNSEPCQNGEHEYVLVGTDDPVYGGMRYFHVDSCPYYSGPHNHHFITITYIYHYECSVCGHQKTVYSYIDDDTMGERCPYNDFGK